MLPAYRAYKLVFRGAFVAQILIILELLHRFALHY